MLVTVHMFPNITKPFDDHKKHCRHFNVLTWLNLIVMFFVITIFAMSAMKNKKISFMKGLPMIMTAALGYYNARLLNTMCVRIP